MQKRCLQVSALATLVALVVTGVAFAALPNSSTMTFGTGEALFADGYSEAGLNISATTNKWFGADILNVDDGLPGERELLLFGSNSQPVIFDMEGAEFILVSLDIERENSFPGTTISSNAGDTITLGDTGTFALGWRGITSFTISGPWVQNAVIDNIVVSTSEVVDLDIKPGSSSNPVNPNGKGVVPVAILTTEVFNASTVDAGSVEFGINGVTKAHKNAHLEDVDADGDVDLLMHFRLQDSGISHGDIEACVTGRTGEGGFIQGCDSIKTPGK